VVGVDQAKHHLYLQRFGVEGEGVRLDRRYLEKRTPSREPAIQHAYALTTYSTESKTFDSAFALLDSGISREDFTVAISRSSGPTTAYGVAASELTDADIGPGRREVEDAAHDLRVGAERAAGEYAAIEVGARKRIEAMAPLDLAARRAELERRLTTAGERTPAEERLADLEQRIATAEDRLAGMSDDHTRQLASTQLRRLETERDSLTVEVATETPRRSELTGNERAELALIEDRLVDLRRRAVAAERSQPSAMIVETLGPRPKNPLHASLWNNGVDAIYGYRQRYGVVATGKDPLGGKPRDAAQRRHHREAQLRIARVQKQLGKQRARSATRIMRIGR